MGALLAAEGIARFQGPGDGTVRFPGDVAGSRAFVRPDPHTGFVLTPGYADGLYRVNEAGFRGPPLPRDLHRRLGILCAGDSTTFGWLVAQGGDFPAQLRGLVRQDGRPAWVVNSGVPSFTSAQVLRKLEIDLERLGPDIVVVTMPWNDIWYAALEPWTPAVLVPHLPSPWRQWLLGRSALFRWLSGRRAPRMQLDRAAPAALDAFKGNLAAIAATVHDSGAILVFQTPPLSPLRVSPAGVRFAPTGLRWSRGFLLDTTRQYVAAFEAVAGEKGVRVVRNPLFMPHGPEAEDFVDEIHPTADGYRVVATTLFAELRASGLLPAP
jgi:lysophospholipase L1-like esterase